MIFSKYNQILFIVLIAIFLLTTLPPPVTSALPIELVSERTATAKVYDIGGGQKKYQIHMGNIHYPDTNGDFKDIDTTLINTGENLVMNKNFYQAEVPLMANGIFSFSINGHTLKVRPLGLLPMFYKAAPGELGELGKSIRYENALGEGIHYQVNVRNNGMENLIIFDSPPQDTSGDFIVPFEVIEMPQSIKRADGSIINHELAFEETSQDTDVIEIGDDVKIYITNLIAWDSHPSSPKILPVKIAFYTLDGETFMAKIIPKEIFDAETIYPVYADPTINYDPPTSGNGYIETGTYQAWDTSHDATTGDPALTQIEVGSLHGTAGSNTFQMMRGSIPIDTSGIDDAETVTAATLNLWLQTINNNNDNDGDDWINIELTTQADATSLVDGDYDNRTIDNPTEGSTRWDVTGKTTGQYHTWALNATGLTWVNKTGYTLLGVREGHDALDDPITTTGAFQGNRVTFSSDNTAGQEPYLEVVTVTATAPARVVRIFSGFTLKIIGGRLIIHKR